MTNFKDPHQAIQYPPICNDETLILHNPMHVRRPFLRACEFQSRVDTFHTDDFHKARNPTNLILETMVVMQANVQAFSRAAIRDTYFQQLLHHRVFFFGAEETRDMSDSMIMSKPYFIVRSLSDNGQFGCRLYISRTLPYARKSGHDLYIARSHIVVLLSQPR